MPANTKYKIIVCPVNKELNYKVHAGINMSQKKRMMNPTYMVCPNNSQGLYNNMLAHEIQIQPKFPLYMGKGSQNLTDTCQSKRRCK